MAKIASSHQAIGDAYEVVNQYNWDEQQLIAYEQEKKRIRDNIAALNYQLDKAEAKGLEKGKNKERITIAKNLLSQNIDYQVISDATGLSIEEIKGLLNLHS